MENSKIEQYRANRAELIALSKQVKALMESGEIEADSINDGLIELYTTPQHREFNTFWQWKDKGFSVVKGAKSFKVWGSPRKGARAETPATGNEEPEEYKYWPICYLFSNAQVRPSHDTEHHKPRHHETHINS